jgi:hypothetical protein
MVVHFGQSALMSLPHLTYLAAVIAVVVLAIGTAWRFGASVVPKHRTWTRAWLILLSMVAAGPSGWLVPFGAIVVIARYGRVWRPSHRSA